MDDQTWSKFEIPQALDTDAEELCNTLGQTSCDEGDMAMFSGVTADDLAPFTRRGGRMQGIRAPLGSLSYAAVNALSKVRPGPGWVRAQNRWCIGLVTPHCGPSGSGSWSEQGAMPCRWRAGGAGRNGIGL